MSPSGRRIVFQSDGRIVFQGQMPRLQRMLGHSKAQAALFQLARRHPRRIRHDDMVEVQFKNTRKGYYKNSTGIPLKAGDLVAVEAQPGHDIGTVTLTGALVRLQMRKSGIRPNAETKRVFRKAKPADIDKYNEARAREQDTMIRARKIAQSLQLDMKIGDVEYQGDGNKAIFYYIADARVDFRQLIKVLADTFKIRIEMKQIGARQEAGRIGGIGPCGRPLCCSSWMQTSSASPQVPHASRTSRSIHKNWPDSAPSSSAASTSK